MNRDVRTDKFVSNTLLIFSMIALLSQSFVFGQIGWSTILSKAGRYTVSMPGKPTELGAPFAMGDFRGVSHVYHSSEKGISYSASYADLAIDPSDSTIAEKVFSAAKADLLEKARARVIAEKNLDLKGIPGREIKVQAPNGIIISRSYLAKNRFYQVVAVIADNVSTENAEKFFDTFSLIEFDPSAIVTEVISPPPPPPQPKPTPCAAAVMPKRVRRSEGVIRGSAVNLVRPNYPIEAKNGNVEGKVEVEIVIDEEGNVEEARGTSGPALLQESAVSAARASKFKPTIFCGVAIKTDGILTYRFSLN